jgi:2-aminoadipate transaminase
MSRIQVTQVSVPEGKIDLGIGQPDVSLLPLDQIAQASAHRFAQGNSNILQYGSVQGNGYLRIALAQFLSEEYSVHVDADDLFITGGVSQALDLICTLLTRPGDTIFVEEPSYFLALRIFADHYLNIVGVPIDQDGLIIEALEKKLSKQQPVFLYTIPTFHNPAGVTLSAERRVRLINLSEQYNFLVVADEVYHLLTYTGKPPLPLASYAQTGRILSLGSFSKILAPGLRLGWMQAASSRLKPFLLSGVLDSGGGLNPFVSSLANSMIELGLQQTYLNDLRKIYRERLIALSKMLRQHVPSITFIEPYGGYFIWSCLPEGETAVALLAKAEQHQVRFQPGSKFSSLRGLNNYIRVSFSYYGIDALEEGVERLALAMAM